MSQETKETKEITVEYIRKHEHEDPILRDDNDRFIIYPIKYKTLYAHAKKHQSLAWFPANIDLSKDIDGFNSLNGKEKRVIKHVLAFFANGDAIIMENISVNFAKDVKIFEARSFYAMQMFIEDVHATTYGLMITTYITNEMERLRMFTALKTIKSVKRQAEWAMSWMNNDKSFSERLIAFAAVEGIFFSAPFCIIFYFMGRGMPGLIQANKYILRDENLHTNFAGELLRTLKLKPSQKDAENIIDGAVGCCIEFAKEALPEDLPGLRLKQLIEYIKHAANVTLAILGYKSMYKAKNPFTFMKKIGLENKTNFFEGKNTSYTRAKLSAEKKKKNNDDSSDESDDDF